MEDSNRFSYTKIKRIKYLIEKPIRWYEARIPFPILLNEILDQLRSTKYFSVFDIASRFHQILMHQSDIQKRASSPPYRYYHFNRMPSNALLWIKECISHVSKIHGSGIINIIKERYVRLSWRHCHLHVFSGRTLDKIQ